MATFKPQGFGQEAFGDPFGSGGPLFVVRALAVGGQTLRVVFDEAPRISSAVDPADGLNPANYLIEVVSGTAKQPLALQIADELIVGPAKGVLPGDERGVDVSVDAPLAEGVLYRVTCQRIESAFGGALGAPFSAEFFGVVPRKVLPQVPRLTGLWDFASEPFRPGFTFAGGDVDTQAGLPGLKKRIFRRLSTTQNAFSFLPGYGLALPFKAPVSLGRIGQLKTEMVSQVQEEPEVEAAQVALSLEAGQVLFVSIRARTREGALLEMDVRRSPDGTFVAA